MKKHIEARTRARTFFDEMWSRGDPWELEACPFEQAKYARQLLLLGDRRYARVLEIGCGAGWFTRSLATRADRVLAVDVSAAAIQRAEEEAVGPGVEFRVQDVIEMDPVAEGPWDLIVFSETIYYLGWLYPFFDVAYLASQLHAATAPGGRLLLVNTCGGVNDYLLRPWLIRTYRDLFLNVGFAVDREETLRGDKHGASIEVLASLFVRPVGISP